MTTKDRPLLNKVSFYGGKPQPGDEPPPARRLNRKQRRRAAARRTPAPGASKPGPGSGTSEGG